VTPPVVRLHLPALLLLACLVLVAPPPAVAQTRDASPSARELRQAYPLHDGKEPAAAEAATPASTTPAPSDPPREGGSSQASLRFAVAAVMAIIAFAAGFALALRPSSRRSQDHSPPSTGAAAVTPTIAASDRKDSSQAVALPPTTRRGWTAETEWCPAGGEACFRVVARATEGTATAVVAESARFEWPPAGAAVPALTAAAEELETRAVAAGWRPLPPGDAWYAKRYAWEPVASMPAAPGRFDRRAAWPENTERLWRCEVELDEGPGDARFRAVVRRPGSRHGRTIGASTEVRGLAAALLDIGWEAAGTGTNWYSERFVWRGEGTPPDRVAPISTPTSRTT
jgi:hypothetical protein